mgnify:CR=1 FL=1
MIPARFTSVVFGFLLSGLMTLIVTGVTIAQQPDPTVGKWLAAFGTGWLVTFPTVLVVAPIVRRLVAKLMAPEPEPAPPTPDPGPAAGWSAEEFAEVRRNGDPTISAETKAVFENLTAQDWEQHTRVVDELTKHDFDDLDADL